MPKQKTNKSVKKRIRVTGDTTWLTVVGVVGAIHDDDATRLPAAHLYVSLAQNGSQRVDPGPPTPNVPAPPDSPAGATSRAAAGNRQKGSHCRAGHRPPAGGRSTAGVRFQPARRGSVFDRP